MRYLFLLIFLTTSVFSFDDYADLVLYNGSIYSADSKDSFYSAIVIDKGRIRYLGNDKVAKTYIGTKLNGTKTDTYNLNGKTVLPGFHDVHIHPLEAGSSVGGTQFCNLDGIKKLASKRSFNVLKKCLNTTPTERGTNWILGWGHELDSLIEMSEQEELAPLKLLDKVSPFQPMAIMEKSSHSIWVNSAALKLANIHKATKNPTGGIIVKSTSGQPTGLLLENAGDLIFTLAMNPKKKLLKKRVKNLNYQGLLWSIEQMAKNGITSISVARVFWKRGYLETWKKVNQNQKLKTRTNLGLWAYPDNSDNENFNFIKKNYSNDKGSLLKINQIKLYSDGLLHNTTAAVLTPYKDPFKEVPKRNGKALGMNYFSEKRIAKYIRELEKIGYDFHIHAIGDRAVQESLNAVEKVVKVEKKRDRRHRITHLEKVHSNDFKRFKKLNVSADLQLGGAHIEDITTVQNLKKYGARITLSSDWDVNSLNPFNSIDGALNQGLDLKSAIKAHTINGAYVMRQEKVTGTLELGKLADIIVLDRNLFETPRNKIKRTKVIWTILEGNTVFE